MRAATQRGFAYIILLISIAIISIGASAALLSGARMARRGAEEQLLFVGNEFQKALVTYTAGTGGGGPKELSELLRDPRFPGIQRYLRRVYADPLTGSEEWGLRRDPAGHITGVFSLAPGTPIKQTGFERTRESFEAAASYSDWVFGIGLRKDTPSDSAAFNQTAQPNFRR